jgi:hypothetical protein
MARQAAQTKMGFYPIDPFVIESIIGHLAIPKSGARGIHLIDPCCGKGQALHDLAKGLGVPWDQVYGVELDGNRAAESKALMPDAHIAGPASIFGMRITGHSYSLVYINPPFDFEFGGGQREEQSFAEEAFRLLTSGGVMVLVCPLTALNENRNFCQYIDSRFEDVRVFALPDGISRSTGLEYRRFKEIIVIGKKRRVLLTDDALKQYGNLHIAEFEWRNKTNWEFSLSRIQNETYKLFVRGHAMPAVPRMVYTLPAAWRPMSFHKSEYLPEELTLALETSPLNTLTRDVEAITLARPPIAPGKGHVALLLASGQLDGLVEADDGNHVVRGTAKKVEYWNEAASKSEVNPETGALTTKDVFSQKVVLVIRACWQDGQILTLSDQPPDPSEAIKAADDTNEGRGERPGVLELAPFMSKAPPDAYPYQRAAATASTLNIKVEGRTIIMDQPGSDVNSRIESIVRASGNMNPIPPWEG